MSLVEKYLAKLPEDWQFKFLDMYDAGCSDWEIMREFGIKPKEWKVMYHSLGVSEFQEVVEHGNALSRAWWEREGRTNLNTPRFNTRLYDIQMQNRFGWAKKAETTETETGVASADQESIDRRLAELLDKEQVSGDAEV